MSNAKCKGAYSISRLSGNKMIDQHSPEFAGSFEPGHCFIVPTQMLGAKAAKSHTPTVAGKPGVLLGGPAEGKRAGTVGKSVNVTFHPSRVDENMAIGTTYRK